jgi:hypothetical protein
MPRRPAAHHRLVPLGLLVAAAIAGVVAGLLSALANGAPTPARPVSRTTVDVPLVTGPLRTALPGVAAPGHDERLPVTAPERPGRGARVIARVADPYGGPDWAVRTFTARSVRTSSVRPARRVAQTCAQVGRLLDGLFVWIDPHRPRALGVPVNTTSTTVCTGRGRGVVLGALRLPAAADPGANPQISATVVWGLSPRARTPVALRSPDDELPLPALGEGVRLRVVRGDLDVGRRTVVADGAPVEGGIDNAWFGLPSFWRGSAAGGRQVGATAGLRPAAVVADPSSDRPMLVATSREPRSGTPCFAIVDRLVGGEPVRSVAPTGALAPSQALCQTVFDVPTGRWTFLSGGASSNGSDRDAEHRRLRERRTLTGSSSQTWAFPREIAEVDVEDPLGVRTIRTVPLGRVSIVHLQRAGDLAVGGFGFRGGERRVFTGRKADGTTVVLRPWHPR